MPSVGRVVAGRHGPGYKHTDMRAIFFGTPDIAVPALRALTEIATVIGVVCQPDRPAGRGLKVHAPAVKQAAEALGLEVYQPVAVRSGALARWVEERAPDFALVMAYGRILPAPVLNAPRLGALNLHASLLPKYRGAAPINWAIIRGETETGISLMQMDEGMDTGPVYHRAAIAIRAGETAGELAERLAALGADVTRKDLPRVWSGELAAIPQAHEQATYAPLLDPELRDIDWHRPARELVQLVRGLAPRPAAVTHVRGKLLKVMDLELDDTSGLAPGRVRCVGERVLVGTGSHAVSLRRAQLEGKRPLDSRDLINGRALRTDDQFTRAAPTETG